MLNSISEVKGFVGRGMSTDGKSHYPMGSNDQTMPWFLGLWRYWEAGVATKPGWTDASYLLFSALGTKKTAFFIDNVKMEQVAK